MDHYVPGDLRLRSLGDLIADNVELTHDNTLYSPIEGQLICVKLEIVDYENYRFGPNSDPSFNVDDDADPVLPLSCVIL